MNYFAAVHVGDFNTPSGAYQKAGLHPDQFRIASERAMAAGCPFVWHPIDKIHGIWMLSSDIGNGSGESVLFIADRRSIGSKQYALGYGDAMRSQDGREWLIFEHAELLDWYPAEFVPSSRTADCPRNPLKTDASDTRSS